MTRRWLLVSVLGLLLSWAAWAAEPPLVLQPGDSTYSAVEQAALRTGISAVTRILQAGYPVPRYRLADRGWTDRDFVLFVAGTLESHGYQAEVVETSDGSGGVRLFVLVGVDLGTGKVGWIPVEASPSALTASRSLGIIPWVGESETAFDPFYMSFDQIANRGQNAPPTVAISGVTMRVIIDEPYTFMAMANDRDGVIIAYLWTFDGDEIEVETSISTRYTFRSLGEKQVELTVIDNRGARASTSVKANVVEEGGCGCGG